MKVTLTIPDSLYDTYTSFSKNGTPTEVLLQQALAEFPIDLKERYILIDNATRKQFESVLAAPIYTKEELLRRVSNHAAVTIGNIRLSPTAAQMNRLAARAKANKRTAEEEAENTFKSMAANFFGHV